MVIKHIQDINTILPLHDEIFGKPFPISSYYKKCTSNTLDIFVYEEDSQLLGYSIIVDQEEEKNLYAWYGGVLPKFQGSGITQVFFETLINLAREKNYISVTVASSNLRPHMLRLAIKMGFDIYDIKKRDSGEGNKIYFRYGIFAPSTMEIPLVEHGVALKPVEIEEKVVRAYKSNCVILKFTHTENLEVLNYAIKYCNSFSNKPQILLVDDFSCSELSQIINQYKGKISIIK